MTPQSQIICDALLSEGWKEWQHYLNPKQRLFAKNFPGYAKCRCNDPKDKQVEVYWHSEVVFNNGITMPEFWSVENVGELPDGQWLRMEIESLNSHALIERAVLQLLEGWNHVAKISSPAPEKHP